jgi:hypothetical protein
VEGYVLGCVAVERERECVEESYVLGCVAVECERKCVEESYGGVDGEVVIVIVILFSSCLYLYS